MIRDSRLHLSLAAIDRAALREESRQRLGLTLEQSAILNLLDRVEALEREIARLRDG